MMVKIDDLKAEIKEVEYRYNHSTSDRARYMNWRRLIKLKKMLATYYGFKKEGDKKC